MSRVLKVIDSNCILHYCLNHWQRYQKISLHVTQIPVSVSRKLQKIRYPQSYYHRLSWTKRVHNMKSEPTPNYINFEPTLNDQKLLLLYIIVSFRSIIWA